jgi:hypothetical protein
MKKRYLLVIILLIPIVLSAQRKNRYRYELVVGLGAGNFLGELGGANAIGSDFVKDLEISQTRPAFMLGLRYKNSKRFGVKTAITFGMMNGNDALTQEPFRNNRNLMFRSPVIELSSQLEFYFTQEQQGHLYKIKNAKGMKRIDWQWYLFAGIGGFYYNPQALYDGKWVNLRPLSTEGQGIGGAKKYLPVSVCIPMGSGIKYGIDRKWSIGLEYGLRKTFTDYIDDVSTVYYDKTIIAKERGIMAAELSDPSLLNYPEAYGGESVPSCQSCTGSQRGDATDKDSYMFGTLTINYKFIKRKRTRSKF